MREGSVVKGSGRGRGRPPGMSVEELRSATMAEMRRLSKNGVAPSLPTYNRQRSAGLTTAQNCIKRLGQGWPALAREAGLLPANGTAASLRSRRA